MSTRARLCLWSGILQIFVMAADVVGQGGADRGPDSVTVVPGPDYAAGGVHRFFWGDHYRDAWTTRVAVPVLDLQEFAGGLTPISAGGGFQTKSLWLRGADGKIYAFRSVYKNATELVPEVLRDTYVEDLFQDQMSTQHPFAALVVDRLLEGAGVLHSTPRPYVLPDDGALGEFRTDFSEVLGTLAERPVAEAGAVAAFLGAREVIDGFEVVERVMADPARRVHARSYLTARLIDVLVGDWDRHADQWRWASFGEDSSSGWRPIPEDRDQAFARLDGLVLGLGRRRFPMLTSFRDKYDDMSRFHYQARFIDRLSLTELERPVWDSTAAFLVERLNDATLDEAIGRLPSKGARVGGPFLGSTLARRRDGLPRAAADLYELLAREPYIHASHLDDIAELTGTAGGVVVAIRTAGTPEPYFRRVFRERETKEIRIYLHAGDDRAVISGAEKLPIKVRIIGGAGDDEFRFETRTGNVWLYDQHGTNRISGAVAGIGIDDRRYPPPTLVPESGSAPPPRHWGNFGYPFFTGGFNPDVGLLVGGTYSWFDYGFRKDPYASRLSLSGAVSTVAKFAMRLAGDLRFENSPLYVALHAHASSFETVNFFGTGNDTERTDGISDEFYAVENTRVEGEASLRADFDGVLDVGLGVTGGFANTRDDPDTFLGQHLETYGAGRFGLAGGFASLNLTTRQPGHLVETATRLRAAVRVLGSYFPALIDVEEAYGWLNAVASASVPLGLRRWEVGLRGGGRKIWGDAPWFQLAFVGGAESLRGWRAQRFAGDASLYGDAELRLDLFDFRLIFPTTFGVQGLFDAGRVWVDGNSPGGWHSGYGGGIWLALRGTRSLISFAYAESDEDSGLYVSLGFPF